LLKYGGSAGGLQTPVSVSHILIFPDGDILKPNLEIWKPFKFPTVIKNNNNKKNRGKKI